MANPFVFDEPQNIAVALLSLALRQPDSPAYIRLLNQPQIFNWGQIAHWVASACDAFEQAGVHVGDHVASVLENSAEWFVFDFACQVLGLVHVAIDVRWSANVISKLLLESDAKYVFLKQDGLQPALAPTSIRAFDWLLPWDVAAIGDARLIRLTEQASERAPQTAAQMLFTSGTTGLPKGVLLSHRNLVSNALAKLNAAPQLATDLRLNVLPFCHAYARTCELSTWVLTGGQLAIASNWQNFLFQAQVLQPTLINLVPHLVNKLVQAARAQAWSAQAALNASIRGLLGGQVRLLQIGGASLPQELWRILADAELPPLQGYGLTEASPVVCSNRSGCQRAGTIGTPVAGVEVKVDAEQQLWVRGDNVMLGYYRDEQSTQARIRDGWLATGDLVESDQAGHFHIVGRKSAVLVLSTGFKVSPELVESKLMAVEWLEQLLVVGEGKPFPAILAWPALVRLPNDFFHGTTRTLDSLDVQALEAALTQRVAEELLSLPPFMRPRKIRLMTTPVSDSELTTAKGSLRRQLAIATFKQDIDQLYVD